MKRAFTLLLGLILFALSLPAQTKRALVIGIGTQEDPAWSKINGDKDVPYVLEILNNANYEQIITCVNTQATKAGIVEAFGTLTDSCQPNDIVYVHFSGHGQQMRDKSNDESDALDECWIPYDAYLEPCNKDRGEKHLVDDEVNTLLHHIRDKIGDGGKLLVVVDACHSGDSTRGEEEIARGTFTVFETNKLMLKPLPIYEQWKNVSRYNVSWITISACKNNQKNYEMRTPVAGKLTYALYTVFVKNRVSGDNKTIFDMIARFIKLNTISRSQSPEMTDQAVNYNITDILM